MEWRKEKSQRSWRESVLQPRTLFYFLGILVLVLYHMRYDLSFGDVVDTYGSVLKRGSEYFPQNGNIFQALYNFTVFHYTKWSSRNIIEAVLMIVGVLPVICWHILDILTVVLIGYCLDESVLIKNLKLKYLMIFSFLMMYQVVAMRSAGWMATTINYSWTVAMALYMYLTIQRIRRDESVSKISYVFAILASVYALNHEQMNGMMLLLLGMILLKDVRNRKIKKAVIPFLMINLAEFFWIILCPGNACRMNAETVSYFPEYADFCLIEKAGAGGACLLKALFDKNGMALLTLFCAGFLMYIGMKRTCPAGIKVITVVPVVYTAVRFIWQIFPQVTGGRAGIIFGKYGQSKWTVVFGCLILVDIFVVCWYVTRGVEGQDIFLGALLAAAATKIVLGFSLAFLVSGERTSIYLTFTLILAALWLVEKFEEIFLFLEKKIFLFGMMTLNVCLFIWNYQSILSGKIF